MIFTLTLPLQRYLQGNDLAWEDPEFLTSQIIRLVLYGIKGIPGE